MPVWWVTWDVPLVSLPVTTFEIPGYPDPPTMRRQWWPSPDADPG